jgi:hypothetical protein
MAQEGVNKMEEIPHCERCGVIDKLESDHIKPKVEGGTDDKTNKRWLCTYCHDFRHAELEILKAIKVEEKRLIVLRKRLDLLRELNTPEKIKANGYQTYFKVYDEPLPINTKCMREA